VEAYWDGVLRFQSKNAVADGKWHNIVAVYYAGAALYIDGVIESSTFNLQTHLLIIPGFPLVRFMSVK
jgi:hypothetical protein